jgi:hypothetical protein
MATPGASGGASTDHTFSAASPTTWSSLCFGTTGGEARASTDEGRRWRCLARHLPEIYTVQSASLA